MIRRNFGVIGLLRYENRFFLVEGMHHLGESKGALFELHLDEEVRFTKIVDFAESPAALTMHADRIYVAGHQHVYVLEDFKVARRFDDIIAPGVYPNSIVVIDERAFVGMRGGILEVDLNKGVPTRMHLAPPR